MEMVLEAKGICFGYDEKYILENSSLNIYKGDFLGIVGPNGSAKSTLLKIMLGILKPQKGSIRLLDSPILIISFFLYN